MGGHTIDEVKLGNSYARNPLMANFCAKTMPYRGLGSGIPRVLAEGVHVEFVDSKEGNQFTVRVGRPLATNDIKGKEGDIAENIVGKVVENIVEKLPKPQALIVRAVSNNPKVTAKELGEMLSIAVRNVQVHMKKLQDAGVIRRVGPDKGGHWEIIKQ